MARDWPLPARVPSPAGQPVLGAPVALLAHGLWGGYRLAEERHPFCAYDDEGASG